MPYIVSDRNGPIISVKISGEISRTEVGQIQAAALRAIQQCGKISALFILDDFRGWKREGNWGDISFMTQHDKEIARIAVVGDEQWRDLIYAFLAKGFRSAEIEYFSPADLADQCHWTSIKEDRECSPRVSSPFWPRQARRSPPMPQHFFRSSQDSSGTIEARSR